MINRLTERQKLDTAIDEAHSEMVTYRQLPELSTERRVHFNAFLRHMEDAYNAAREVQAQYPMAHSNRVSRGGR